MTFDSTGVIIFLSVMFAVIGVVTSIVYYFLRYYVKTDATDKELLTQKPLDWDKIEKQQTDPSSPTTKEPPKSSQPILRDALSKTRESFWSKIKAAVVGHPTLGENERSQLEEILYLNDLGPQTVEMLLQNTFDQLKGYDFTFDQFKQKLRDQMMFIVQQAQQTRSDDLFQSLKSRAKPQVWMVAGVNGAGKTTSIGKLASQAQNQGFKTMIVAGDTFRAAADEQLKTWAERAGVSYYSNPSTKDPSAVAYSGLEKAKSEHYDLVIVDTAGRLHTQGHLMEELKKMTRIMTKVLPDAPNEKLLVVDANSGQNALFQAREFHQALGLSGLIVTKLDGSSKGGVVLGICNELKLPVTHIGIGEGIYDLRPFSSSEYVEGLIE